MSTSELAAFHWFQTMLAARRLRAPDGRPLYKYDLKPDEASKLESLLRRLFVAPVPKTPRLLGAAYCIWTSHWFQKRFCGGPWSWAGAAAPVSAPVDFPNRTHLVIEGMEYLKRPIRTSNGWHEYLHTLISEGGFPNRLISEQRNKWLTRYVEAVTLAASCGDASLAAAIEHASYYQFIVPPAFRASSLFDISAELAFHVANLRRRLSENGVTDGAVEWLNRVAPNWREELPITADDAAARMLVEGLVRASACKPVMPVSCCRVLKRSQKEGWSFGLRMEIEGRIDDVDLPPNVRARLGSLSRARILPAGALERAGLPAIGVASRVSGAEYNGWEIESLLGRTSLIVNEFPINEDARLIFSIGRGTGVEFVPSGGTRISSDILVFRSEVPASDESIPSTLVLVGTGSTKDRESRLFLAVPQGAIFETGMGSEVVEFGAAQERRLIAIKGVVTILIDGDRYVVQSGADQSDSVRLEPVGQLLEGAGAERSAFLGCPELFVHHGILKKSGDGRILKMRASGRAQGWSPFNPTNLPYGLVDVAAIDGKGTVLDRLTFIHLPGSARINVSVPHDGVCRVSVTGVETSNVEAIEVEGGRVDVGERSFGGRNFEVTTTGMRSFALKLRLRWEQSEAVFSVPILATRLAFYRDDGSVIPRNALLSQPGLRGASVESVGKATILITCRERVHGGHPPSLERNFERSLPFSQIRDDIGLLFSMTNDLDAEIRVEALHNGAVMAVVRVQRFDITLIQDREGQVRLPTDSIKKLRDDGADKISLFGRPFRDVRGQDRPVESNIDFKGTYWTIEDRDGPWFVYAKTDGEARSRPLHVNRSLWSQDEFGAFLTAVTTPNREERQRLVLSLLEGIGSGEDAKSRGELIDFIGSLDPALPLQAFDAISMLSFRPAASVQLAVFSSDSALRTIMELDEKLPMNWFTTDPASWSAALGCLHAAYRRTMTDAGLPAEMSLKFADDHLRNRIQEIARRRPGLSVHLAIAMNEMKLKADSAAINKLREAYKLVWAGPALVPPIANQLPKVASDARKANDGRRWPSIVGFRKTFGDLISMRFDAPTWAVPVLDAPFAAAAIALGDAEWSPEIERMLRVCRAFDTSYFEEAYLKGLFIGWAGRGDKLARAA